MTARKIVTTFAEWEALADDSVVRTIENPCILEKVGANGWALMGDVAPGMPLSTRDVATEPAEVIWEPEPAEPVGSPAGDVPEQALVYSNGNYQLTTCSYCGHTIYRFRNSHNAAWFHQGTREQPCHPEAPMQRGDFVPMATPADGAGS
jgi:hypothetical protein